MALLAMNSLASGITTRGDWSRPTTGGVTPWGGRYGTGDTQLNINIPTTQVIVSCRHMPETNSRWIMRVYPSSGDFVGLIHNSSGILELRRGLNTVMATASASITVDAWNRYEMKVNIADSGTAVVRKDGEVVLNYSGDLKTSGSDITHVQASFGDGNGNIRYSDIVVQDTTGPAPFNDFIGDFTVSALVPNANGASSQFVGSDGNSTDNYLLVDEIPWNTADYVGSGTPGNKDLYNVTDVAAGATVLAVQTVVSALKTDSAARGIKFVSRSSGGVSATSAEQAMGVSYTAYVSPIALTDPNGDAWTVARLNGAQFGVEVV